jgi:hypothetical protein
MHVYRRSPSLHHIYHPHGPARAAVRCGDKDSPCSLAVFFTSQHPSRARPVTVRAAGGLCRAYARTLSAKQENTASHPVQPTRPCRLNHPLPSPPAECETPAYTCRASTTPVSELPSIALHFASVFNLPRFILATSGKSNWQPV